MRSLSSRISIIWFVVAFCGILTVTISLPRFIARTSFMHEMAINESTTDMATITSIKAVSTSASAVLSFFVLVFADAPPEDEREPAERFLAGRLEKYTSPL